MDISLDSYPVVNEAITLRLTPFGAYIEGEKIGDYSGSPPVFPKVNETGREVLRRCDGTKSLRCIVHELVKEQPIDEYQRMARGVLEFIKVALQKKIVEIYREPISRKIQIVGSTEYYVPQHMSIELTSDCNLRCVYCYRDAGPEGAVSLQTQQMLAILESLACQGVRVVELTGGEPLLHPGFFEILDFCVEHFGFVSVLSNGSLINTRTAERLALLADHLFIQVDLDGSTPDLHDTLRGVPGAFERTKQGIVLLAQHNIRTRVVMNVTKSNIGDIEATLLLAKSLGATRFSFAPVLDIGRGRDIDIHFTKDQLEYLSSLPFRFHKKYGDFYHYIAPEEIQKIQNMPNCGAGHGVATLGPTGKVRPCLMLSEEYLTIGDLTTQTVEEVFSNPVTTYLHDLTYPNPAICGTCKWASYCQYCIARGILTQERLESRCSWFQKEHLEKWVSLNKSVSGKLVTTSIRCPHTSCT